MLKAIICESCGVTTPKRGNGKQKYCVPCSEAKAQERKARHLVEYRKRHAVRARTSDLGRANTEHVKLAGQARVVERPSLSAVHGKHVGCEWLARIVVPFSYAASKNFIYGVGSEGHVFLRKKSTAFRQEVTLRVVEAVRNVPLVQNKLWLDIYVEKPDHKGDAVNVVDLVCDAVKDATGLDDRWYSIRRLDWAIVKNSPRLIIGLSQDSAENVQACSACGRLLVFSAFTKKANTTNGIDRVCRDCRSEGRRLAREARASA